MSKYMINLLETMYRDKYKPSIYLILNLDRGYSGLFNSEIKVRGDIATYKRIKL